jgi:hypothetical protein
MNIKIQEKIGDNKVLLRYGFLKLRKLGKELIQKTTAKERYPFREEYLLNMIEKLKLYKGKSLISFDDFPSHLILKFNHKGKLILKKAMLYVKQKYGLDATHRKHKVNFYLIKGYLDKKQNSLTIGTLTKYFDFFAKEKREYFSKEKIESSVIEVKPSIKAKALRVNGLPIDLREDKWASIFGIIPDTHLKQFVFVAEDIGFARDIISAFEKIGIKPHFQSKGKLTKIRGNTVLGHIVNTAGIKSKERQLMANNPLPAWIFSCSKKYHGILLSKFLDTEGYVPKTNAGIRITQSSSIDLTNEEKKFILSSCKIRVISSSRKESKIVIFSKLTDNLKEKVLQNPSFFLISIQLLLMKYKIKSIVYPVCVYISSNGRASISWHLTIMGFENMKKFYDLCGEYISVGYKKQNLKAILSKQKQEHLPKNMSIHYYLDLSSKIENKKGYFTTIDLAGKTSKKRKTIINLVGSLAKQNLVEKIGKKGDNHKWRISNKGREMLSLRTNFIY